MSDNKYHFISFASYTTKKYIKDCVAMARDANASAVRMKRMAGLSTVLGETGWVNRANSRFDFARRCIADARRAKTEG
jgi:hypothetical protein